MHHAPTSPPTSRRPFNHLSTSSKTVAPYRPVWGRKQASCSIHFCPILIVLLQLAHGHTTTSRHTLSCSPHHRSRSRRALRSVLSMARRSKLRSRSRSRSRRSSSDYSSLAPPMSCAGDFFLVSTLSAYALPPHQTLLYYCSSHSPCHHKRLSWTT